MEKFPFLNEKLDAGIMREPSFGPISLNLNSKTILVQETGEIARLSNQQYQIIWLLVRAQGNLLTNAEIENFLYEDLADDKDLPLGNTLHVQLDRIKDKLNTITKGKVTIECIRDLGWRLELT